MTIIDVVSHTHWDREWYHSAGRFRQRLVALIDDLLDAPSPHGAGFLLDGQAVVLDDYLRVRPERASELSAALRSGFLEAGPWFVLPDELIPGAEALVRNLLAGRRTLRSLRASSPAVLYCPDSFGHPAALGTIARGFGCEIVIAWRGFRSAHVPGSDACWWIAPDGERVLLYHLSPSGYELGSNLPVAPDAARSRWSSIATELLPRIRLGVALLLNGADHHARQQQLEQAIAALAEAARPVEVRACSLASFAAYAVERARAEAASLDSVRGELRDSYGYTWTLAGTLGTRAHQKRRSALLERMLVREIEPWTALASRRGRPDVRRSRRHLVDAAWRSLLLCHPHDTLCGCCTDMVARAMEARLDDVEAQAVGLRDDALLDVIGHEQDAARVRRSEWKPIVVVSNATARPRSGVAILRLTSFLADTEVGLRTVPGGNGADSTVAFRDASHHARTATPSIAGVAAVQSLSRFVAHERTESARHYPDDDLVSVSEVAAWIGDVPAYGVRCFEQGKRTRRSAIPNPVRVDGDTIVNGRISLRVRADGRVAFTDLEYGRTLDNLLEWESVVDAGDLYTPSPRSVRFDARFDRARVVHRGPLRATIEAKWRFRPHASSDRRTAGGPQRLSVLVRFSIDADARTLRIEVFGENGATQHRLRLCIATGISQPVVVADAAFGPIERRTPVVDDAARRMERPLRTAPLHRYVSLFDERRGVTLFSDGLAEYEAGDAGEILVTLVRSVGQLSRADVPERPGHAGWPVDTPEAQCSGPFAATLSLMLHGPRTAEVIDDIEQRADDVLLPLAGATLRSALTMPEPVHGIELRGTGLGFSSAKESEDGEWLVLRCVNLLEQEQRGEWRIDGAISRAMTARLDETPLDTLAVDGNTIGFVAPARSVVTVLAR